MDLLAKTERAANHWPTFKYGALSPVQKEVVSWLAFNTRRPTKIKGNTLRALVSREIVEETPNGLALTDRGREYAKTMR